MSGESSVKEHVVNNQKVYFSFYREGVLYYKTEKGLLFEVPISDTGSGCFNNEDRAILFMRWIRKQVEANEQGRLESQKYQRVETSGCPHA